MADHSPVMALFRAWEPKYRQAGDLSVGEEVADALLEECGGLERQMMATPVISVQDFAAKLIVATGYGDFMLEGGKGGLLDEALAILNGTGGTNG